MDLNRRIIDMTLGELLEAVDNRIKSIQQPAKQEQNLLYSIKEISQFLGVSKSTVNVWKKKGILDGAIMQCGKGMSLIADGDKLLEIVKAYRNARGQVCM